MRPYGEISEAYGRPKPFEREVGPSWKSAAANFEVADGVLRLRRDRASQVPLGNLPLTDAAGDIDILGFTFRPARSGVGITALKRAALATSVLRSLQGQRPGGAPNNRAQNADVVAVQEIRGALGQLDRAAAEGLNQVLYKRAAAPGAMTEASVTQAADTIAARWTKAPKIFVVHIPQGM